MNFFPLSAFQPMRLCLWALALLLLTLHPSAQAQRVALLVGNASYQVGRLTNPPNDVAEMERALSKLGFTVQKVLNANQNQMKRAVRDFGTSAQGAEVAFVYYSGHATQAYGENYLLPVGASIDKESDYAIEAIAANDVLAQIRGAQPKAAILVLDACRDNPLAATTRSATKGLRPMNAPTGTMIAFATEPNKTASDNGNYARVLARELQKPGQELLDVFRNTGAEVKRLSGGKQEPRISEVSINERIYLASVKPEPVQNATPATLDDDQEAWDMAKRTHSLASYQTYLENNPQGRYAKLARQALKGMQPVAPNPVVQPAAATPLIDNRYQVLGNGSEIKDVQTGLVWQRCSVGQSWTGSTCAGDAKKFSFDDAQMQASNGWRVPTVRELHSLVWCSSGKSQSRSDPQDGEPAIDHLCDGEYTRPTIRQAAFPNSQVNGYWTSTPKNSFAWGVNFGGGSIYIVSRVNSYHVRLVR